MRLFCERRASARGFIFSTSEAVVRVVCAATAVAGMACSTTPKPTSNSALGHAATGAQTRPTPPPWPFPAGLAPESDSHDSRAALLRRQDDQVTTCGIPLASFGKFWGMFTTIILLAASTKLPVACAVVVRLACGREREQDFRLCEF
jgi:hypothetical protein